LTEKEIILPDIDQLEFFGPTNSKFKFIQSRFPKLKIIARGNHIKVNGDDEEIERFELKLEQVFAHLQRYSSIAMNALENILDGFVEQEGVKHFAGSEDVLLFGPGGHKVIARTVNQKRMVEACDTNDMVFAIGPAGSGKTYTAVALAVRALKEKQVKRIILTRPAVEAGENLGFLPGDLKEKLDPYMQPLYDALMDMIPYEKLADYIEKNTIEIAPLAFMRGRTLDKAFVILDEAQNATVAQMKMFLTRMGRDAKFIITGDATQVDLPRNQPSGLLRSVDLVRNIEGISVIELTGADVVRHKLVKRIIEAFERND
jgi:phosphate starvation-inducible PhoH-like protein